MMNDCRRQTYLAESRGGNQEKLEWKYAIEALKPWPWQMMFINASLQGTLLYDPDSFCFAYMTSGNYIFGKKTDFDCCNITNQDRSSSTFTLF